MGADVAVAHGGHATLPPSHSHHHDGHHHVAVEYDPMDVVYRSGGDKYLKDREARKKAKGRRKPVEKTASGIGREMLDEYHAHLFQVVQWRKLNEDFEWLPDWAQEMDQGARAIQRIWRMRGERKKRQELQAKMDGSASGPFMKLNSWRGWKVANDVWKKPLEEAKGSLGAEAKCAAREGVKRGGEGLVLHRKHKDANQLQPLMLISSRTLFKSYMLSPPQQLSAPQASIQATRKVQLKPLEEKLQEEPNKPMNREPPAKAPAAAEPMRRNAAGAKQQSLIEDPNKLRSSPLPPQKPPSHEPRRTRAAPPERLALPQEDSMASGSAMSPSLVSPALGSFSLLVSPMTSGSKHPQQPPWGNPQGQSPKPGHQGHQASRQPSRFRPPADAPQPSRPQQRDAGRIGSRMSQGLRPPESGASNSPSAARFHQRQQQGGGGGIPQPHQDENSKAEPEGPRPPESLAPNSPAAPWGHQLQQQKRGRYGGGAHADVPMASSSRQRNTGLGGGMSISHQDSRQPGTGASNSHAYLKAQQQQQGGEGERAPSEHPDEGQKGQPPTNHDSYGTPSTQGLVDAILQEMHMWRYRVFVNELGRKRSDEELSTHAERCTRTLIGRLSKALEQTLDAKGVPGSSGSMAQLAAAVAHVPDLSGLEPGVREHLHEFAMALEVDNLSVFAVDIAAKKLIKSCEEALRASVIDEGGGLNKQRAGVPLPQWDSETTPSSSQISSGGVELPDIGAARMRNSSNTVPHSIAPQRPELEPPGARGGASLSQEHSNSSHGSQQQQMMQQQRILAAPPDRSNLQQDNQGGGANGQTPSGADNKAGLNDKVAQIRTSQRGERNTTNRKAPNKRSSDKEIVAYPPVQQKPVLKDQQRKAAADRQFKNDRRRRRRLNFVARYCDDDDRPPEKLVASLDSKGKGR